MVGALHMCGRGRGPNPRPVELRAVRGASTISLPQPPDDTPIGSEGRRRRRRPSPPEPAVASPAMRLVVARCSVEYSGRLSACLPEAVRLLMLKADGSVLVHCDGGGYKPLNRD